MLGSGVGLLAAGRLLDQGMDYGPVMLILAAGPVLVAVLVAVGYPETAHLTLEQLNPEDRAAAAAATGASAEAAQEGGHS